MSQKKLQSEQCPKQCPESKNGEQCATCLLSTAVERDEKTQEVIDGLDQSIEETKQLTAPMLDKSANRTDWVLFAWVSLILIVAVMWAFGQSSPARICGGAM